MGFFRRNKEEILFGYIVLINILLFIIVIYAIAVSAVATDLADLIQTGGC